MKVASVEVAIDVANEDVVLGKICVAEIEVTTSLKVEVLGDVVEVETSSVEVEEVVAKPVLAPLLGFNEGEVKGAEEGMEDVAEKGTNENDG